MLHACRDLISVNTGFISDVTSAQIYGENLEVLCRTWMEWHNFCCRHGTHAKFCNMMGMYFAARKWLHTSPYQQPACDWYSTKQCLSSHFSCRKHRWHQPLQLWCCIQKRFWCNVLAFSAIILYFKYVASPLKEWQKRAIHETVEQQGTDNR